MEWNTLPEWQKMEEEAEKEAEEIKMRNVRKQENSRVSVKYTG